MIVKLGSDFGRKLIGCHKGLMGCSKASNLRVARITKWAFDRSQKPLRSLALIKAYTTSDASDEPAINIGALIIRTGVWGPLQYIYNKKPLK